MKIAIIGATGRVRKLLINEALKRNYKVTAIVRNASKLENKDIQVIEKPFLEINKDDLNGFDVVINAIGIWTIEEVGFMKIQHEHFLNLLAKTKTRYIVVGGVGSLYTNPAKTTKVIDSVDFPKEWITVASGNLDAYNTVSSRNDVLWTFFSPAYMFDPDGKEADKFIFGDDILLFNKDNESYLSYIDGAKIILDEIVNKNYIQKRFTAIKA